MLVGVEAEVTDGVIVSVLLVVLVGVAVIEDVTVAVLLGVEVDVCVPEEVGDVDGVAEGRGVGIFCKTGKSLSTACHTVSASQHSCCR